MNGRNEKHEMGLVAVGLFVILAVVVQPVLAVDYLEPSNSEEEIYGVFIDGPTEPGVEGYTMYKVDPNKAPSGWDSAVLLQNTAPEYHWWNGCSPTAAGMVFAYWDTYLGKTNLYSFYDGNSSYWDKDHMSESVENNYGRNGNYPKRATHSIVASWEHYQAGQALGLNHGSWDRNGNGSVDQSDRDQWNCLADFMRTQNGGTSRSNMDEGFEYFAAWDDPETTVNESYEAVATNIYSPSWSQYTSEIDSDIPVHVGIPGHSIFGCGYWDDPDGVYGDPGTLYVVNRTTWASTNNKYGLVAFDEVYAFTKLRIGDPEVPPNNPPVAGNDEYFIDEDGMLVLYGYEGVLLNDTDADGDPLTAIKKTNTAHGTLEFYSTGALSYTPNSNYHGTDTFTYVANDTMDNSNVAIVTLNVASINDVPISEDDSYGVDQDGKLTLYGYEGVLSNDVDYDEDDQLEAVLISDVSHGNLSLWASGALTYTPDAGFSGIDSFTYKAYDGEAYSELTTVLLEILAGAIPIPGDTNGDSLVNQVDMDVVTANWGKAIGGGALVGDFNDDGYVNAIDASILAANWGDHTSEGAPVPEPSMLVLLLGLGMVFGTRRHR